MSNYPNQVQDHKGNMFPSIHAMCLYWGIDQNTFRSRRKRGLSLEKALETPLMNMSAKKGMPKRDHTGHEFTSFRDMCDYWDLMQYVVIARLKSGMTLQKALETPDDYRSHCLNLLSFKRDHLGNRFNSFEALCIYWGVPQPVIRRRYCDEWKNTVKGMLETPIGINRYGYVGPLGESHKTLDDLYRHYNVSKEVVRSRLKEGWTLKEAFGVEPHKGPEIVLPTVDHKGKQFKSFAELCRHWDRHSSLVRGRLLKGWTLERALETPTYPHGRAVTDHKGNVYDSIKKMCIAWGIPSSIYISRRHLGWSQQRALETPAGQSSQEDENH